jgi:hypothetical protein
VASLTPWTLAFSAWAFALDNDFARLWLFEAESLSRLRESLTNNELERDTFKEPLALSVILPDVLLLKLLILSLIWACSLPWFDAVDEDAVVWLVFTLSSLAACFTSCLASDFAFFCSLPSFCLLCWLSATLVASLDVLFGWVSFNELLKLLDWLVLALVERLVLSEVFWLAEFLSAEVLLALLLLCVSDFASVVALVLFESTAFVLFDVLSPVDELLVLVEPGIVALVWVANKSSDWLKSKLTPGFSSALTVIPLPAPNKPATTPIPAKTIVFRFYTFYNAFFH